MGASVSPHASLREAVHDTGDTGCLVLPGFACLINANRFSERDLVHFAYFRKVRFASFSVPERIV